MLTERLEIRLDRDTVRVLREEAERRGVSVGQLVRQCIDLVLVRDAEARRRAAEAICAMEEPVADWPALEAEIMEAHVAEEP